MKLKWSRIIKLAIWLLTAGLLMDAAPVEGSSKNRIVCYSTSWSYYRTGTARFIPNDRILNPHLCTHLIYFFAKIENDTVVPTDKYVDIDNDGYKTFTGLKSKNQDLKTLISISEQQNDEPTSRWSLLVGEPQRRIKFIESVLSFVKRHNFDGIDLVWAHPSNYKGNPNDKKNLVTLVEELRIAFTTDAILAGRDPYIITMAVPFLFDVVQKGYDVRSLSNMLDWFNLLTYDYHASTEPIVLHHAPLYTYEGDTTPDKNVNATVSHYLEMGADRTKIVIGITTYGRTFTLSNPTETDYGSPASGVGVPGPFTKFSDSLAYYEICDNINSRGWNVVQKQRGLVGPYAHSDKNWVAFDDEAMVMAKADYVALNGLGGLMFWTIDLDDFHGKCSGIPFTLVTAGKNRLNEKLGITPGSASTQHFEPVVQSTEKMIIEQKPQSPNFNTNTMISSPSSAPTTLTPAVTEEKVNNRIVCYSTNWSFYRTGTARFIPNDRILNPHLCTHLIYFFAKIENDTVVPTDKYVDIDNDGFKTFTSLKSKNSNLKTLISISEQQNDEPTSRWSILVGDPMRRIKFIESVLGFIKEYNFDGIDLVWAHPSNYLGSPSDKSNLVTLVEELRSAFNAAALSIGRSPYIITMAVPFLFDVIERGYDIKRLNRNLNWFNLLTYDYHPSTETYITHHAALYPFEGNTVPDRNVNATVSKYLELGADRTKIVIGLTTYGRTFTLSDPAKTEFGSPSGGVGVPGPFTKFTDSLAYYEICENINNQGWNVVQNQAGLVGPYAHNDRNWVAFDDEAMVMTKADYVALNGLGGLMFWTIDLDDFRGKCSGIPFTLVSAGKNRLNEKLNL